AGVEPELGTRFVNLASSCAVIQAATETPAAISAHAAPVRMAADATGFTACHGVPGVHHHASLKPGHILVTQRARHMASHGQRVNRCERTIKSSVLAREAHTHRLRNNVVGCCA